MSPKIVSGEKPTAKTVSGEEPTAKTVSGEKPTAAKAEVAESASERGQRGLEVKVGAFVALALIAAVGIVLVLAQKRHVFEHRVIVHTVFQEVEGLREGAPVRLSGVNIGTVSRIAFAKERRASLIHVDMEISRVSLARMGKDSVARIGTQGLLGDKIIELSVSEKDSDPLLAGDTIESQPPADINKMIQQASDVLAKVKIVADGAAVFVSGVSDEKTLGDIRNFVTSLRNIANQAEKGPGLAHALFYDPEQAKTLQKILVEVDGLAVNVSGVVHEVDGFLQATDANGKQLINNVSRAAKNVGEAAGDIHDSKIVAHLDKASGDLADLTTYVKSGKGTVGMAIMDPTVYEQLVTVLGGVARSRVLRALVRYAITKDDGQKVGRAVDEPEAPATLRVSGPVTGK